MVKGLPAPHAWASRAMSPTAVIASDRRKRSNPGLLARDPGSRRRLRLLAMTAKESREKAVGRRCFGGRQEVAASNPRAVARGTSLWIAARAGGSVATRSEERRVGRG